MMLSIIFKFYAKTTTCHWMIWITSNFNQFVILNGVQKCASVGTVLCTCASDNPFFAYLGSHGSSPISY